MIFVFLGLDCFSQYYAFQIHPLACKFQDSIIFLCCVVSHCVNGPHFLIHSLVSSIRFNVVGFMLRSLIHLGVSFVHGDRYGSMFILLHVDNQLGQQHLLNMLSFFQLIFLLLCQKSGVCGCVD